MKTKTKIYSLMLGIFFLSMFFVGATNAEAADCDTCVLDCVQSGQSEYDCTYDFCSNECGGDTPLGSNSCPAGTKEDPNDPNYCIEEGSGTECDLGYEFKNGQCVPTDACPDGYFLKNGECVNSGGQSSQCDYGYVWDGQDCVATDSCPDGYAYVNGQCVDTNGNATDSECDPSPSCWFYNCCSSASNNNEPTPEEIAAAKKDSIAKLAAAKTAMSVLNNAIKNKTAADAVLASCGKACSQEQIDAANLANQKLLDAQAAFDEKVAAANAAYSMAFPTTAGSTGAGFNLCANGMVAMVCSGGGGTPIVAGIGTGGYSGGGGGYSGGNYGSGGAYNPAKCGTGFSDVGGVCFPMNTGLSEASISQIAFSLFSWLMGLFTTLAVLAFVVSGIQYFMSSGDESMAESAKENAKNAIVGIVVGLSGFIIVKAIAAALSGQSYFF